MKGMKSCPKCKGGECKGGKGCIKENALTYPKRGQRTATTKAKMK
jgi:hypothetical protein